MKELIKKLTSVNSVSGNEETISQIIKEEIIKYVDKIYSDTMGNLIAVKNGSGPSVMFCAHMDQIGIIVSYIEDNGFIRFSNMGGVDKRNVYSRRVIFKNGIEGIVCCEQKADKDVKLDNYFIDIGASSKEEALSMISIGDTATYTAEFIELGKYKIASNAMDDRVGCACLIQAIKNINYNENTIYFVFTVQEELGLRGAKTAGFTVEPDYAIAIDVTHTGDTPNCEYSNIELSKGPTIKFKDNGIIANKKIKESIIKIARDNNIEFQPEVLSGGSTDVGAIQTSKAGVLCTGISIPTRYIHSPVETVDIRDVENTVKFIEKICETGLE